MGCRLKIGVIGAGVIGVSVALVLTRENQDVTLIDRSGVASGASGGNAGAFAFSDVIPLATPGVLRKAPRWFFDPRGPLSIPPRYALRIAPWLVRFWRASSRDRYEAAVNAQTSLMDLSRTALERLVTGLDLEGQLRREGQLQLYQSEKAFKAALPGIEQQRRAGMHIDLLTSAGALADIQPGLAVSFNHGAYIRDWINVYDPRVWVERLAEAFVEAQGRIVIANVSAVEQEPEGIAVRYDGADVSFDRVVIATGAHSGALLSSLGVRVPLDTERGYNTTLPPGAFDLRTHVTFPDHGFVVSRIRDGLRVGGAVELGGLDLPANMQRAEALLDRAAHFLPGLKTSGGTQWMGFRPSLPDSLPVIDFATDDKRIVLAFGHGHLGLTQSVGTAELVADMMAGRQPSINPAPFGVSRFGGVFS